MDLNQFLQVVIAIDGVLIAMIGSLALLVFNSIKSGISEMKVSFQEMSRDVGAISISTEALNGKIAVICERVDSHEKRIDRLEKS